MVDLTPFVEMAQVDFAHTAWSRDVSDVSSPFDTAPEPEKVAITEYPSATKYEPASGILIDAEQTHRLLYLPYDSKRELEAGYLPYD